MTITSTTSFITLPGNGVQTVFSFPFVYGAAEWISVVYTDPAGVEWALAPGTYTLTLNPAGANALWGVGGVVTYQRNAAPIPAGSTLTIRRTLPETQLYNFLAQQGFNPVNIERALDQLCMVLQQVERDFIRDAGGQRIQNVGDPIQQTDAANAKWVEAFVAGVLNGAGTVAPKGWSFTGDGIATSFPIATTDILTPTNTFFVSIDGVAQTPGTDFTINQEQQLITFDAAPPAGASIYVRCFGYAKAVQQPAPGTIVNSMLANMPDGVVLGRMLGAGVGVPQYLTPAQVRTTINALAAPSTSGGAYGYDGGASGDVFYWRRTMTGTKTVGAGGPYDIYSPSAFMWDIRTDDAAPSDPAEFLVGFRFRQIVTSNTASGGREGVSATLEMRSATASGNLQRHYSSLQSKTYSFVGDGGTDLTISGAKGAYFGGANAVYIGDPNSGSVATNIYDVVGNEMNTFVKTGSTMRYLSGLSVALCNAVRGSQIDAFIRLAGQGTVGPYSGHIGSDFGIIFTNANSADPTYSGSTLFGSRWFNLGTGTIDTTPRTITNGIDLSGFTATNALFLGRTARILDDGGSTSYRGTAAVNFGANGVNLLALSGVAGAGSWTLQGRGAGASPYIQSGDDIIFRAGGGGTLDVNYPTTTSPGGSGWVIGNPTGWLVKKLNGTTFKQPYW